MSVLRWPASVLNLPDRSRSCWISAPWIDMWILPVSQERADTSSASRTVAYGRPVCSLHPGTLYRAVAERRHRGEGPVEIGRQLLGSPVREKVSVSPPVH